jgi:hypothetical protein
MIVAFPADLAHIRLEYFPHYLARHWPLGPLEGPRWVHHRGAEIALGQLVG